MKIKRLKDIIKYMSLNLGSLKIKTSIVCVFLLFFSSVSFANRFNPPSLDFPLQEFDSRIDGNIFNVDFLIAHIVNNGRKTVRETGEIINSLEDLLQDTAIFTNSNDTGTPAAGSVIIPPGTSADTIIILNQNEGDSIAIQR